MNTIIVNGKEYPIAYTEWIDGRLAAWVQFDTYLGIEWLT